MAVPETATNNANADRGSTRQLTLVYIMGYGRSGSTILDILLNNHEEIVSVGAISGFYEWDIQDRDCACSKPISQCDFWKGVKAQFYGEMNGEKAEQLWDKRLKIESRRSLFRLLLDRHPRDQIREYTISEQALFEAVSLKSNSRFIVDSSKSARLATGRAYALQQHTTLDVKVIYLVRDGRAVMWSAMKGPGSPERSGKKSPRVVVGLKAMLGWIITNLTCLTMWARLGDGSVLEVRYEDLVMQPEYELNRIGKFIGLSMEEVMRKIRCQEPLMVAHNIGGNRLRFSEGITLRPDFEWTAKLPRVYKLIFWLTAWPLAKRFRYKLAL